MNVRAPRGLWAVAVLSLIVAVPAPGASAPDLAPAEPAWVPLIDLPCDHPQASSDDDSVPIPPNFEGCIGQIRPGARMTVPNGCTYNFVFTDGTHTYIGTAGHCATTGQRVGTTGITGTFGTVVFSVNAGNANDFALIRIDADKLGFVNPRLCTWGGPTAAHAGSSGAGSVLLEYGWGIATQVSAQTRSRIIVQQSQNQDSGVWNGVGSGGDSGAPVVRDGTLEAFGIHTHGVTPVAGVVLESGPYIQRILTLAQNAGFNIQLVTASP
jgi:hypothetical protein